MHVKLRIENIFRDKFISVYEFAPNGAVRKNKPKPLLEARDM
jgi:hypothetical protein